MAVKIANRRISATCPARTAKDRFMSLDRDKAYSPIEVSEKWGVSERTVEDHARKIGCLLYMETDKGWEKVILNPDVAVKYRKK